MRTWRDVCQAGARVPVLVQVLAGKQAVVPCCLHVRVTKLPTDNARIQCITKDVDTNLHVDGDGVELGALLPQHTGAVALQRVVQCAVVVRVLREVTIKMIEKDEMTSESYHRTLPVSMDERDGQQTGVLAKPLLKYMPRSVTRVLSWLITLSEPNVRS